MGQQLSLVEALMDPRLGANAKLARIDALIDWARLEPHAARVRGSEAGRPPYPPLSMLKALYLQALYDLSDPIGVAMLVDERLHVLDRRSSSAIAKYAEALGRISFTLPQLPNLPLQRLDPVPLLARRTSVKATVPLSLPKPSRAASPPCSRSSPRSSQSLPIATHGDPDAPAP